MRPRFLTLSTLTLIAMFATQSAMAAQAPSRNYHSTMLWTGTQTSSASSSSSVAVNRDRPSLRTIRGETLQAQLASESSSSTMISSSLSSSSFSSEIVSSDSSSSVSSVSSSSSSSIRSSSSSSQKSSLEFGHRITRSTSLLIPQAPDSVDSKAERLVCKVQANLNGYHPSAYTWSRISIRLAHKNGLTPQQFLYLLKKWDCRRFTPVPPTPNEPTDSSSSSSSSSIGQPSDNSSNTDGNNSGNEGATSSRRVVHVPSSQATNSKPTLPTYTNNLTTEQLSLLCRVQRRAETGPNALQLREDFAKTLAERWNLEVRVVRSALNDEGLCAMAGEIDAAGRNHSSSSVSSQGAAGSSASVGSLPGVPHRGGLRYWIYALIAAALILPPLFVLLLPRSPKPTARKR